MTVKILMLLKNVPVGSIVTKKTGTFLYIVADSIRVFNGSGCLVHEYYTPECYRLLISTKGGDAHNLLESEKEVIWHASVEDAKRYIDQKYNNEE